MTVKAKEAYDFLIWLKSSLTPAQYSRCEKLILNHRIKRFYDVIKELEIKGYI